MAKATSKEKASFDVEEYLNCVGFARRIVTYRKGQIIFTQGESCQSVGYLHRGRVKLTVISSGGREAIIALRYAGEFVGEGCIAGQPLRVATASAMDITTVLMIEKQEMVRVLHEEHEFSDRFVAYMLKRNVRIEEDLTDQLFNSSEKRLARTLLLIARHGKEEQSEKVAATISQETLAEMIGTSRGRVSFFMNKFRRLGYVKYNGGGLHINRSLLSVVLQD